MAPTLHLLKLLDLYFAEHAGSLAPLQANVSLTEPGILHVDCDLAVQFQN
ncbi:MAG: hypothetical protein OXC05_01050 [Halieaceae bacterium]|nr:hypothetical protein [Halieaceae bacterium]